MATLLQILQTPPELLTKEAGLEAIGQFLDDHPGLAKALIGGAGGYMIGHFASNPENRVRNGILGALAGAGAGYAWDALSSSSPKKNNSSSNNNNNNNKPSAAPSPEPQQQPAPPTTTQPGPNQYAQNKKSLNDTLQGLIQENHRPSALTSDYDLYNKFLADAPWEQQVQFFRELQKSGVKFNRNRLNSVYTALDPDLLLKYGKGAQLTYLGRLIQAGAPISFSSKYSNGAPALTGNTEVDKVLADWYSMPYAIREDIRLNGTQDSLADMLAAAQALQAGNKSK